MVQFFSTAFHYDHPWKNVIVGMWQKYPNPQCAHVISVDVLDRTIDPVTGVLRTERILGCKQAVPRWILGLIGGQEEAYMREISFVDPKTRTTTLTTVNLSLSEYMTVVERISYVPSIAFPKTRTQFRQVAEIKARAALWKSLGEKMENISLDRFKENAIKGKEGFEGVLRRLFGAEESEKAEAPS